MTSFVQKTGADIKKCADILMAHKQTNLYEILLCQALHRQEKTKHFSVLFKGASKIVYFCVK